MAKKYDATLKQLIDTFADDWAQLLRGFLNIAPEARIESAESDLSVMSLQADKLFRVGEPAKGLNHLELEARWDDDLPRRMMLYNVVAEARFGGPVRSLALMLRREALATSVTGQYTRCHSDGREYLNFCYDVIRLWELPSQELMAGPIGTLPLALLTDDAQPVLPGLVHRVDERLRAEQSSPKCTSEVLTACDVLLGLRYNATDIARLFQGVRGMEESTTYQAIMQKGAVRALRNAIVKMAERRFGPPSAAQQVELASIDDPERLSRIHDQILDASDWDELLATP